MTNLSVPIEDPIRTIQILNWARWGAAQKGEHSGAPIAGREDTNSSCTDIPVSIGSLPSAERRRQPRCRIGASLTNKHAMSKWATFNERWVDGLQPAPLIYCTKRQRPGRGANCDKTATTCVSPPGPKLECLEAQRGQVRGKGLGKQDNISSSALLTVRHRTTGATGGLRAGEASDTSHDTGDLFAPILSVKLPWVYESMIAATCLTGWRYETPEVKPAVGHPIIRNTESGKVPSRALSPPSVTSSLLATAVGTANLVSPPVPGRGPNSRSPIKPIGTNLLGAPNFLPVLACSCHQVPPGLEATPQSRNGNACNLQVASASNVCTKQGSGSNFSVSYRCISYHSFFLVPFMIPPLALTFTIHHSPLALSLRPPVPDGRPLPREPPLPILRNPFTNQEGSPGTIPVLAFPLPGSAQSSHPVSRSSHKMQIFPTGRYPISHIIDNASSSPRILTLRYPHLGIFPTSNATEFSSFSDYSFVFLFLILVRFPARAQLPAHTRWKFDGTLICPFQCTNANVRSGPQPARRCIALLYSVRLRSSPSFPSHRLSLSFWYPRSVYPYLLDINSAAFDIPAQSAGRSPILIPISSLIHPFSVPEERTTTAYANLRPATCLLYLTLSSPSKLVFPTPASSPMKIKAAEESFGRISAHAHCRRPSVYRSHVESVILSTLERSIDDQKLADSRCPIAASNAFIPVFPTMDNAFAISFAFFNMAHPWFGKRGPRPIHEKASMKHRPTSDLRPIIQDISGHSSHSNSSLTFKPCRKTQKYPIPLPSRAFGVLLQSATPEPNRPSQTVTHRLGGPRHTIFPSLNSTPSLPVFTPNPSMVGSSKPGFILYSTSRAPHPLGPGPNEKDIPKGQKLCRARRSLSPESPACPAKDSTSDDRRGLTISPLQLVSCSLCHGAKVTCRSQETSNPQMWIHPLLLHVVPVPSFLAECNRISTLNVELALAPTLVSTTRNPIQKAARSREIRVRERGHLGDLVKRDIAAYATLATLVPPPFSAASGTIRRKDLNRRPNCRIVVFTLIATWLPFTILVDLHIVLPVMGRKMRDLDLAQAPEIPIKGFSKKKKKNARHTRTLSWLPHPHSLTLPANMTPDLPSTLLTSKINYNRRYTPKPKTQNLFDSDTAQTPSHHHNDAITARTGLTLRFSPCVD
ncbi:uncharacterized protein CLUP02_03276 [Colletotrichum lupini]|uniref:Cytochrome c domain-containing protein n=1 Tax=Colletotrichum lupini TaxID=145971 RepID=A0A9Q8SII2_9PEZI|nr:uncharacterized protein CLUP02_03276 [Colletotrichum lupini]UQC77805.1 hypothetical protein CLUP02_03276 [Colletotrichum lupini]